MRGSQKNAATELLDKISPQPPFNWAGPRRNNQERVAMKYLALALLAVSPLAHAHDHADADPLLKPIEAPYAEKWLAPQAPLKIHGNTYYVGFGGMSLVLIRTEAGLVLIDGALPQAVPAIEANIRQLGFRVEDVKYILNTEVHFDHAGGIAALARDSGATVLASASGVEALRAGKSGKDDPQFGELHDTPPVTKLRAMRDGETLRLGGTTITAHATPGHTPGSTSWSWQSCENGKCLNAVFVSSLNPISNDTYRFTGKDEPVFRKTLQKVAGLPCDILITAHPEHSGGDDKLKRLANDPAAFVDPNGCRSLAAKYDKIFDARLAKEKEKGAL
jgi:metallo-beta-lactamase class B